MREATEANKATGRCAAWPTGRELERRYNCGSRTVKRIASAGGVYVVRAGKRWLRYDVAAFDAAWKSLAEQEDARRGA